MTMKVLGFSLFVAGFLLAVAPAGAQTAKTAFDLDAVASGGQYYFTITGETAHNPTLVVPANTDITVTIHNKGGAEATAHNFCFVDNQHCSEYVSADGDTKTYTFNSGASGGDYYCQPHKATGMAGKVQIEGQAPAGGNDSPGFGVVGLAVALVGVALLLRRK
jgi:plastocyanin